ncbi:hypothetical protein [Yoonia vestfoldensis]|uniref:hypothetical protein n=1 Tax=Yoonia vestfoldensis TaxID=245188 RepID=UPI001B7FB4E4|nr:hypothetical protein [Yoonia vestfoldensis]
MRIVNVEALFQQMQQAVLLDHPIKAFKDLGLPIGRIARFQLGQFLALCRVQKLPEHRGVEGELSVEITGQADAIGGAAHWRGLASQLFGRVAGQVFLNGLFECDFASVADHAIP